MKRVSLQGRGVKIYREELECIQSDELYAAYVIAVDGVRLFATENIRDIIFSPRTLQEEGVRVSLGLDRNTWELQNTGPQVDIELRGTWVLWRSGWDLVIGIVDSQGEQLVSRVPFAIWCKVVERFGRKYLGLA